MLEKKYLSMPPSTQPRATQSLALLQHLSYGQTVSERPYVVQGKSPHPEYHECDLLVGWTQMLECQRTLACPISQLDKAEITLWNKKL